MPRPRFTLKTMLWATTLVAAGLALVLARPDSLFIERLRAPLAWGCWGAAVGVLFGRSGPRWAIIGALLMLPLVALALSLQND